MTSSSICPNVRTRAAFCSVNARAQQAEPHTLSTPTTALERQCSACHVPFGGVPARLCLTCHTALAQRVARGVGFHPTVQSQPCADCHHEHRGRDAQLSPEPPAGLDHRTTGFALEGDHATLACDRCHARTGTRVRWVGLATRCQACHADRAHRGALGGDCARCHRARAWAPATYVAADHRVALTGGHARLDCAACHRAGQHLGGADACALCHNAPHGGTRAPCETCHRVAGWTQVSYTHAFPPSALPGKHQTAPCLSCHPAFRFARTPFACADCHERDRAHRRVGGKQAVGMELQEIGHGVLAQEEGWIRRREWSAGNRWGFQQLLRISAGGRAAPGAARAPRPVTPPANAARA